MQFFGISFPNKQIYLYKNIWEKYFFNCWIQIPFTNNPFHAVIFLRNNFLQTIPLKKHLKQGFPPKHLYIQTFQHSSTSKKKLEPRFDRKGHDRRKKSQF